MSLNSPDLSASLREMAARCRFRSKNCFDLAAASELRSLADELESKADYLDQRNVAGPRRPDGKGPAHAG